MSTTATIQATPAPAWRGDDFPHWLPPMLVRELRQGLSSGAFFWTFLLLQIALVLSLFFAVLGQSVNPALDGSRRIDGIFWTILILGLGLAMPLRGLSAVAAERTGNNLDLVRLTKLSATRIVVGKWLANVAQVLLVAVAVLPYMTVRYFFGGVNIVADLERLGWLLVVAAVVAALAVYYSPRPQRERIGLLVLLAFVGFGARITPSPSGSSRSGARRPSPVSGSGGDGPRSGWWPCCWDCRCCSPPWGRCASGPCGCGACTPRSPAAVSPDGSPPRCSPPAGPPASCSSAWRSA